MCTLLGKTIVVAETTITSIVLTIIISHQLVFRTFNSVMVFLVISISRFSRVSFSYSLVIRYKPQVNNSKTLTHSCDGGTNIGVDTLDPSNIDRQLFCYNEDTSQIVHVACEKVVDVYQEVCGSTLQLSSKFYATEHSAIYTDSGSEFGFRLRIPTLDAAASGFVPAQECVVVMDGGVTDLVTSTINPGLMGSDFWRSYTGDV